MRYWSLLLIITIILSACDPAFIVEYRLEVSVPSNYTTALKIIDQIINKYQFKNRGITEYDKKYNKIKCYYENGVNFDVEYDKSKKILKIILDEFGVREPSEFFKKIEKELFEEFKKCLGEKSITKVEH